MGLDTTAEPGTMPESEQRVKRTRAKSTKPLSAARQKQLETTKSQLGTVGKVLGACPTTTDELIEMWEIAPDDAWGVMIKVQGSKMGSTEMMLLDEVPLMEYNIADIARNFGPGHYFIRPAAGKYASKSAKIPVSEPLARKYGWGKAPTTPVDIVADRTIREAALGPVDPPDMLVAMQRVAERTVIQTLESLGISKGNAGAQHPTTLMEQLQQFREMRKMIREEEEDAERIVSRRMGLSAKEEGSEEQGGIFEKLLLGALPLITRVMDRTAPQITQEKAPQALPYTPPPTNQTTPPKPPEEKAPVQPIIQDLTEEERVAIGPAINLLRPFGQYLVEAGKTAATPAEVAAELAGYIPPNMYEATLALDQIVEQRGPAVLSFIHPELPSDRWRMILHELAAELQRPDDSHED